MELFDDYPRVAEELKRRRWAEAEFERRAKGEAGTATWIAARLQEDLIQAGGGVGPEQVLRLEWARDLVIDHDGSCMRISAAFSFCIDGALFTPAEMERPKPGFAYGQFPVPETICKSIVIDKEISI